NITLDLAVQLSRLIDAYLQKNESQRDLQITTITNSVTVFNGQTILLREGLAGEGRVIGSTNQISGPKSLLVLVTPNSVNADGSYSRLERLIQRKRPNQ